MAAAHPLQNISTALSNLLRAAFRPRKFFAGASSSSLATTALWGVASLLIIAAILLTIVAFASRSAWDSAVGEYLAGNELNRADFPALSVTSALPYEFPVIWLALIALVAIVRFAFLALLGERNRSGLGALALILSLSAISLTPMLVNGLFAAVTGNLFPIGTDYGVFDVARVFLAMAGVAITWFWEGFITVFAYGAVFGQARSRAVLLFLAPWVVMYLLTYVL